jgi:LysR family transcriptional regulator, transcriptional activator of the cysJI operon
MLENFRLKVFRTVAEHLSFRKAGEVLLLTQPAVTSQVKALEDELGARLFERSSGGVQLTQAGGLLFGYAKELRELAETAENKLAELKGQPSGTVIVGASTTIAQYVLPNLLAKFARAYPAIQLQIFSGNTERICQGIASGTFHLGIIEGPAQRRDLKVKRWFDDELLLIVPRNHEWASAVSVIPQKLIGAPLVMRERGSGSRYAVESGLQKVGIRIADLRIVMELDSTEAILSCVEAGLGIGFVSKWSLARRVPDFRSLCTLKLRNVRILRSFSFVAQVGPAVEDPASTMRQFLEVNVPTIPILQSSPK